MFVASQDSVSLNKSDSCHCEQSAAIFLQALKRLPRFARNDDAHKELI
jgi:hypothetical protein